MNWIKENKFLAGFLAITLIVAGVVAFLMMSAKGKADEAEQRYNAAAAELTRLQNGAPFPDAGNLGKMEELKKQHHAAMDELQKNLAATQFPLEPTTPAQFQDKLKETVTRVRTAAAGVGVKLPEKFYMSFDRYETEPPKAEAAAPLLRMLKSMETVLDMLIANQVNEITDLKRDALPEETGKKPEGGKSSVKDDTGKALVVRHPFEVGFVGIEGKFHKFINSLITEKKQFYIPKAVVVKNEKEQGPSRNDKSTPPPAPPQPAPGDTNPPQPNPPPPEEATKMIVGEEKLQVSVKIEVVNFAEPAATAKAEK
jgi:hypothetical protein